MSTMRKANDGSQNNEPCSWEDFVRIWQTSKSYAEVVERSGMDAKDASQRASKARAHGVPLKKFGNRGKSPDWKELIKTAKRYDEQK